ncbi:EAL domain-containing protein [Domibacillus robiginosus]|uniref:EAL domain-containing protein n=1 Tax=Domibacillus robiginosus TaxID=1071054 RepID=UPI00067DA904|nr:EAL domain-containing protein [Domibacillus robiginosus]
MKFLNVHKKIFLVMLVMFVSVVTMGSISLYTSHTINNKTVEVMNKYTQSVELIYNIRHLTEEIILTNFRTNHEEKSDFFQKNAQQLQRLKQELAENLQEYEEVHSDNSTMLYQTFYSRWQAYLTAVEAEKNTTRDSRTGQSAKTETREDHELVKSSLDTLLNFEKDELEKLKNEQEAAYSASTKIIWGALVLFLLLGTTLLLYVKNIVKLNKENEKKIHYLAYHDPLTGLPNRRLFNEKLSASLLEAKKKDKSIGVMFIDIDRFKHVNDTLGHNKGDLLIQLVAQRLTSCLGNNGIVSRRSGDEFTVLLSDADETQLEKTAASILQAFKEPFQVKSSSLHVTSSIGVSIYPQNGKNPDALLRAADLAMYEAKKNGRNSFCFLTKEEQNKRKYASQLEGDLYKAVETGFDQFQLYFQPKVNISNGNISGAEALIRWNHPERGLVSPADFLPLAEESGLIIPIGEWVIREACLQNQLIAQFGYPPIKMGINLSVIQFFQPDLVANVKRIIEETNADPAYLEFEITESIAMTDFERIAQRLEELRYLGVTIAMDDFGTGYSSLNYLKQLPIDTLKIDQSFIKDADLNPHDRTLVKTIIQMAKNLNLHVVAEGVEEAAHVHLLKEEKCDEAQGYYYSRPLKQSDFFQLLSGAAS